MRAWELFEAESALPTVSFDKLWHIGSMDPAQKRRGSYEGAGLSVSLHPQSWSQIARGHVYGEAFELTRPGNQFLNYHEMSSELRSQIEQWGIQNGYIEPHVQYSFSYYDDEWDETRYVMCDTREECEGEAEMWDIDPSEIQEHLDSIRGTEKLTQRTMGAPGAMDGLVPVWVEDNTNLDGVWWQDTHDVSRLSAPRGVISLAKLPQWTVRKLEPDAIYGEDENEYDDELYGPDSPRA